MRSRCMGLFVAVGAASVGAVGWAQTHVQACMRLNDRNERLACYDLAVGRHGDADRALTAAVVRDAFPTPPVAATPAAGAASAAGKARDWKYFIRATTAVTSENKQAAELALVHTGGENHGVAKGAIIVMTEGSLDALETAKLEGGAFYGGVGVHRDWSDPGAQVAAADLRLGYWRVHTAREALSSGMTRTLNLTGGWKVDRVKQTRTAQFEPAFDVARHWVKADAVDRLLYKRHVQLGVTHYSEWVLRHPKDAPGRHHGMVVKLGGGIEEAELASILKDYKFLAPAGLDWLTTHTRELDSERRRSTQHSISATWRLNPGGRVEQGLKLERAVGFNLRDTERAAPRTSLKLTVKY